MVSASAWWDPAYGAPGAGDASVVAAVFVDAEGAYWLHGIRYLSHDPAQLRETDEATQLCRQVARVRRGAAAAGSRDRDQRPRPVPARPVAPRARCGGRGLCRGRAVFPCQQGAADSGRVRSAARGQRPARPCQRVEHAIHRRNAGVAAGPTLSRRRPRRRERLPARRAGTPETPRRAQAGAAAGQPGPGSPRPSSNHDPAPARARRARRGGAASLSCGRYT